MRRAWKLAAVLAVATAVTACDKQRAWGEANSIIAASTPGVWNAVSDTVHSGLEPTIRTVRDERMFQVTWQDPQGEHWPNMRRFRQLLLVGAPGEEWMEAAVAELDRVPDLPALVQVQDVWARGQVVTLILLPREGETSAVPRLLPELRDLYGRQYREWATNRMFLSGRDVEGAEQLRSEHGFSIMLPRVYQRRIEDSLFVFRNDNPDPSELIREVAVTWRSPAPQTIDGETLLAWRSELSERYQAYPQLLDLREVEAGPFDHGGRQAYQVQAVWQNPPEAEWPAAGPFILRAIPCPEQDRLYLVDAWLYAPGRGKYEFMIQLETILDSFQCG